MERGFAERGISLLIVLVSYRMDLIAGTDFICNAVMAAYLVNELLSITENLGLMGRQAGMGMSGAIDLLRQRVKEQKSVSNAKENKRPKGNS